MRVRYKNLFAFTGDAALPLLESFVVEAGRIVPDDAPVDREVDLAGGFVTPLFSDQHTHPSYVAQTLSALAALPPDVLSIEDLVEGLVRKKDELPEDAWIEGWGYDESLLKENRSPTRHDLDRVATDRPVFVRRSDCHSAVVNTYLLKAAGIDRTTPDPEGGRFGRDASGEPDGRLIETAAVRRVERLRKKEDFEGNVRRDLLVALYQSQLSRRKEEHFLNPNRYYMRLLKQIVAEGQRAGEIRSDISAEELSRHIVLLERAILTEWCIQDGKFALGYQGARIFGFYTEFMKA